MIKQFLKKALMRGLYSYFISVTVTVLIGMIAGLFGAEMAWTPDFAGKVGSDLAAAYLQPLLIGLIGFAFGAGSVLFEVERWSFLKQGAAHLTVTAAVWIPVELICFTPIVPPVVISFVASAAVTYAITWGAQYFVWRAGIRRLNRRILEKNGGNNP